MIAIAKSLKFTHPKVFHSAQAMITSFCHLYYLLVLFHSNNLGYQVQEEITHKLGIIDCMVCDLPKSKNLIISPKLRTVIRANLKSPEEVL